LKTKMYVYVGDDEEIVYLSDNDYNFVRDKIKPRFLMFNPIRKIVTKFEFMFDSDLLLIKELNTIQNITTENFQSTVQYYNFDAIYPKYSPWRDVMALSIKNDGYKIFNYVFNCDYLLTRAKAYFKLYEKELLIRTEEKGIDTLSQAPLQFNKVYYQINNLKSSIYDYDMLKAWFGTKCLDPNTRDPVFTIRKVILRKIIQDVVRHSGRKRAFGE